MKFTTVLFVLGMMVSDIDAIQLRGTAKVRDLKHKTTTTTTTTTTTSSKTSGSTSTTTTSTSSDFLDGEPLRVAELCDHFGWEGSDCDSSSSSSD